MNEKGLKHHLDSIQHEAQMFQAYGSELSANSILISKEAIISAFQRQQKANTPKPIEEWHEDDGDCLFWFFPIVEPPYCGNPLDENFPDYVTHFTKFSTPE